jgi:ATP-dependent helicase/nuclease subunit A
VALTRARERLVIVGTVQDVAGRLDKWSLPLTPAGLQARSACWADWIGPMALRAPQGVEAFQRFGNCPVALPDAPEGWKIKILDAASIKSVRPEHADRSKALSELMRAIESADVPAAVEQALSWRYPWGDVTALPSKVSVTSLLDRERNWRGPIPSMEEKRKPRFMEAEKRFSAADLGTIAHTALRLLPADASPQDISAEVLSLEHRGLCPKALHRRSIPAGWKGFISRISPRA